MRYAHLDNTNLNDNGNSTVIGFYDDVIDGVPGIPTPNISLTDVEFNALFGRELEVIAGVIVEYTPATAKVFTAAQKGKVFEAKDKFTQLVNTITGATDITESLSWSLQENEARAYVDNNLTATPLLSAMLLTRAVVGETILDLATLVIAKSDAYKVSYGDALGTHQNIIVQIEAATTVAELDAIVI